MKNKNFIIIALYLFLIIISLVAFVSSLSNEEIVIDKCNQNNSYQLNQSCRNIQRESFSKKLNLVEKGQIDDALLNKLLERDKADNESLNQVINLSMLTNETVRINSVNELLFMDKRFIEKFSRYSQVDSRNNKNVQNQLNHYILYIVLIILHIYNYIL